MERLQEIATRKAELKAQLESEVKDLDLDAIKKELDQLDAEEKSIYEKIEAETKKANEEAEQRRKNAETLEKGKANPTEITEIKKEENKMEEIRNSKEYIEAYARYIKTNDATEVRSLLTENVNGTIAVPDFVYDEIKHAWDNEGVMALVRKLEVKGNLKVNFEISSTGAVKHLEGSQAVDEEQLVEGIATIVPSSFKKWLKLSDEVLDMRGEAFLRYIYEEIAHHIAKQVADDLITKIVALNTTATSTTPSVAQVTSAPAQDTVAQAIGNLSDEATNPVIIMNKLTWSVFKKAQYDGNYSADIFEGLKVVYNNTLPAYNSANANACYMIVGDLGMGALATFPNGINNIEFKYDDKTEMTSDMVRILGREYVGVEPVSCGAFVQVLKPASSI